jgi:hypothetical protein
MAADMAGATTGKGIMGGGTLLDLIVTVIITVTGNGKEYGSRRSIKRSGNPDAGIIEKDMCGVAGSKCPSRRATGKKSASGYRVGKSVQPAQSSAPAVLNWCAVDVDGLLFSATLSSFNMKLNFTEACLFSGIDFSMPHKRFSKVIYIGLKLFFVRMLGQGIMQLR